MSGKTSLREELTAIIVLRFRVRLIGERCISKLGNVIISPSCTSYLNIFLVIGSINSVSTDLSGNSK